MNRLLLLLLLAAAAQAQSYDPPNLKTVLFAGYSTVNLKPTKNADRLSLNGWAASATSYHVFARWGLTAEFNGNGDGGSEHLSYLFGGTYRAVQRKRFALTGRILAGGTRLDQSHFTFGFGQAIDWKLSERVSLRVQPDLRFVRFKEPDGSSRLSLVRPLAFGVVYQFGAR